MDIILKKDINYDKKQVFKTYSQFHMLYNCYLLLDKYIKQNNMKYDMIILQNIYVKIKIK